MRDDDGAGLWKTSLHIQEYNKDYTIAKTECPESKLKMRMDKGRQNSQELAISWATAKFQ